jgi:hypothetical protein
LQTPSKDLVLRQSVWRIGHGERLSGSWSTKTHSRAMTPPRIWVGRDAGMEAFFPFWGKRFGIVSSFLQILFAPADESG